MGQKYTIFFQTQPSYALTNESPTLIKKTGKKTKDNDKRTDKVDVALSWKPNRYVSAV